MSIPMKHALDGYYNYWRLKLTGSTKRISVLTTRDVYPIQTHLLSSCCAMGTQRSWSNALDLNVSSVFCEQ